MADSLVPWIYDYAMMTAEKYGAKLSDVPPHDKKKKVQILQFLTYGSEYENTHMWAEVSDKKHTISVKFSKEAIAEYRRRFGNQRFTKHGGAIASIKDFRIIQTRVPTPQGQLTFSAVLALECDHVSILGSSGESTFGRPESILNDSDMRLWLEGLNQDGGGGNILRQRKQQQGLYTSNESNTLFRPDEIPITATKTVPRKSENQKTHYTSWYKPTDITSYTTNWQVVDRNSEYRFPDLHSAAGDMHTSRTAENVIKEQDNKFNPGREEMLEFSYSKARSATPISWESSPQVRRYIENGDTLTTRSSLDKFTSNASIFSPTYTPLQRERTPVITPSSFPSVTETVIEDTTDIGEASTQNNVIHRPQARKVPRPASPEPPKQSGPVLILAPNSDTSCSQSQPRIEEPGGSAQQYSAHPRVRDDERAKKSVSRDDYNQPRLRREEDDYPWLDLWRIREIMGRTIQKRLHNREL